MTLIERLKLLKGNILPETADIRTISTTEIQEIIAALEQAQRTREVCDKLAASMKEAGYPFSGYWTPSAYEKMYNKWETALAEYDSLPKL